MGENFIHELCRLCLYRSETLVDIFGVNGRHGYLAAEVIQDLLHIEVALSDGYPKSICSVCLDKLTDFKLFRDQCIESRTSFEQEFGSSIALAKCALAQGSAKVNQDPVVCSSSIKTEVKSEVEIVEIPIEDDGGITEEVMRASPVTSEQFDLDVVTIDDDDNILCLGSKVELDLRASVTAGSKANNSKRSGSVWCLSKGDTRSAKASRDLKRTDQDKDSISEENKMLQDMLSRLQTPVFDNDITLTGLLEAPGAKEGHAPASTMKEHTSWFDSKEGQDLGEQGARESTKSQQNQSRKKRHPSTKAGPGKVRKRDKRPQGNARKNLSTSTAREKVTTALSVQRSVGAKLPPHSTEATSTMPIVPPGTKTVRDEAHVHPMLAIHSAQCTSSTVARNQASDGTTEEPSEAQWKHHQRLAKNAQTYSEGRTLFTGGVPQNLVAWNSLGSEVKKKMKRKIPEPPNPSSSATQGVKEVAVKAKTIAVATAKKTAGSLASLHGATQDPRAQGDAKGVEKPHQSLSTSALGLPAERTLPIKSRSKNPQQREGGFPCTQCERRFSTPQTMKRHQILHSGLRPFACNLCDVAYTRIDQLKHHLQNHKARGATLPDSIL